MNKLGVGLYGSNGHQIQGELVAHPQARLAAVAGIASEKLPEPFRHDGSIRRYDTLDALLADPDVRLVSLCSPRRADQAEDTLRVLEAGKHAYAEKACALAEKDLDRIMARSNRGPARFREMNDTTFTQPYLAMKEVARSGQLGAIIEVFVQKSYPYFDGRPQDEAVDGGLITWVGVHALRFVEHISGLKIADIDAVETRLGNPQPGGLRMAAVLTFTLENGALGAALCNYLNPPGFGRWGNEHVRLFGTRGIMESVDGGARTRLVIGDKDLGALDCARKSPSHFALFLNSLLGGAAMPMTLEEELHPTRMALRAKRKADRRTKRGV